MMFSRKKKRVRTRYAHTGIHVHICRYVYVFLRASRTGPLFLRKSSDVIRTSRSAWVCFRTAYGEKERERKKKPKIFHASTLHDSPRWAPGIHCRVGAHTYARTYVHGMRIRICSPLFSHCGFIFYTGWLMKCFTPNFSPRVFRDNKQ
jgi:hypothetical protein